MSNDTPIVDLIQGDPFGRVSPKRTQPHPSLLPIDGRTQALRVLRRYLAALRFRRPGDRGGSPIEYSVMERNIHIGMPDNVEDLVFPSFVFLEQDGGGSYESTGLTSYLDEGTHNKFAPDTAVQIQSEWTEVIRIMAWASKKPERRSLIAGVEQALVPTEQMYGIRFIVPEYYDQTVCFSLWGASRSDIEELSVKNRRVAFLRVEMRFNVVALVDVLPVRPYLDAEVYDGAVELPVGVTFDR